MHSVHTHIVTHIHTALEPSCLGVIDVELSAVCKQAAAHINCRRLTGVTSVLLEGKAQYLQGQGKGRDGCPVGGGGCEGQMKIDCT
jgi:hypothetical protein